MPIADFRRMKLLAMSLLGAIGQGCIADDQGGPHAAASTKEGKMIADTVKAALIDGKPPIDAAAAAATFQTATFALG